LCAEAVPADDPRQSRILRLLHVERGRKVAVEQLAIAPVGVPSGALRARPVAAPFVHEHRDAVLRQRLGEGQVMTRGNAQRRQPQQAGPRRVRCAQQYAEAMAVCGLDLHSVALRGGFRVPRGVRVHRSAAPK
jgi:hypothetical protein